MTRINVGISPAKLTRQHLLAEHREIKRIPNMVRSGRAVLENIPEKFTLGTGHVKFFYDKLFYLYSRYQEIYNECVSRGYRVQNYEGAFHPVYKTPLCDLFNNWQPSEEDINLVKQRLLEKDYNFYRKIL